MFLRIHDDLVNVNDIKTISIEEELISDEKTFGVVFFVVAKTTHDKCLLDKFHYHREAKDFIDIVSKNLKKNGLLIDV